MDPVFLDLHIHSSQNPDSLDSGYDIYLLKNKIEAYVPGSEFMISITDHNTINKAVYLKAVEIFKNILVGVELHIRNNKDRGPYHCHIYFDLPEINQEEIDNINIILDRLYPKKQFPGDDPSIPSLQDIMDSFDAYEYLLLPHGGQSHHTFDKSVSREKHFDTTMERYIYYNHFDGFTARSNRQVDDTINYFKRLGINDFVNLVTSSDNYSPKDYPMPKDEEAATEFVATWMLATPSFNGLRLSLSEASRLSYGSKPDTWAERIQDVVLKNAQINIDVVLTPGLNVVIGGSSSGKTLFVDSIYRKIVNDFSDSHYSQYYSVNDIKVVNPSGKIPYYLGQTFITKVCSVSDDKTAIKDIRILDRIFPQDQEEVKKIQSTLIELKSQIEKLTRSVCVIESLYEDVKRISVLGSLILIDLPKSNPVTAFVQNNSDVASLVYDTSEFEKHTALLTEIGQFLKNHAIIKYDGTEVSSLGNLLKIAMGYAKAEKAVKTIIEQSKSEFDNEKMKVDRESTNKRMDFESLLTLVEKYFIARNDFNSALQAIAGIAVKVETEYVEAMGHRLSVTNDFEVTKLKFLEAINYHIKTNASTYDDIAPELLFSENFKKRDPKVRDYADLANKLFLYFSGKNVKQYKITTKDGKEFYELSAGRKAAVILDLILGFDKDTAPIIIDQPEDNLANEYINHGLLSAIKECKIRKQIILVSHNATIPMLGDAQNIIYCENDGYKTIKIRNAPLEGIIGETTVVDIIAENTDGGKRSIKKRVKKYNLKKFRGYDENYNM